MRYNQVHAGVEASPQVTQLHHTLSHTFSHACVILPPRSSAWPIKDYVDARKGLRRFTLFSPTPECIIPRPSRSGAWPRTTSMPWMSRSTRALSRPGSWGLRTAPFRCSEGVDEPVHSGIKQAWILGLNPKPSSSSSAALPSRWCTARSEWLPAPTPAVQSSTCSCPYCWVALRSCRERPPSNISSGYVRGQSAMSQ